jgi:hypothetical protein
MTMEKSDVFYKLKLLFIPLVFAGIAGGINGFLCFAKFPIIAGRGSNTFDFDWQIIPAGAMHGAILAFFSIGPAILMFGKSRVVGSVFAPVLGYMAGKYSIAALMEGIDSSHSIFTGAFWKGLTIFDVWKFIRIPFQPVDKLSELWIVISWFGLVALIYFVLLSLAKQLFARNLAVQTVAAITSGILGSLWFWISFGPWYFSLIHGTIWGTLTGFGLWIALRQKQGNHPQNAPAPALEKSPNY